MDYQNTFDKRNNLQSLVLDALDALRQAEVEVMLIDSLYQYLSAYIETSNYLIEELLREIAMGEARVEDLERKATGHDEPEL